MKHPRFAQIEEEIRRIKQELEHIGPMRPGTLTVQYRDPAERIGAYHQLSYTRKRRSYTKYIRTEFADQIRDQIETYKRFKDLVERWTDLAIEHSQLQIEESRRRGAKSKTEEGNR